MDEKERQEIDRVLCYYEGEMNGKSKRRKLETFLKNPSIVMPTIGGLIIGGILIYSLGRPVEQISSNISASSNEHLIFNDTNCDGVYDEIVHIPKNPNDPAYVIHGEGVDKIYVQRDQIRKNCIREF